MDRYGKTVGIQMKGQERYRERQMDRAQKRERRAVEKTFNWHVM